MAEAAGGSPPPIAIHIQRKNVIEQIVARRDAGKHLANGVGGRCLILSRCNPGTGRGGIDLGGVFSASPIFFIPF